MNGSGIGIARRRLLLAGLGLGASLALPSVARAATRAPLVEVWKDPNCGCCSDWIKHIEDSGFAVRVFDTGNQAARQRFGLPERYGSCHTARVGGYVVEGHVPASDIRRLLAEKPAALGIAAPGMPVGSPGMDGPAYGGRRDAHDVLLVLRDGSARVFASYR
ncbi:hypothetical protein AT959_02655 [Dechloromonas denitrificans]|uniref:Metal-binding protein n=1 Tax=Dechloromonas denitrificans TaxID=281362 RepID=A0A133XM36_9RHOO|nr:DUF411 domain-containing protein [Dechloromonas denitrificans]KXB31980.1 hypothetical protein AT959_02655 [Dechloromonas denitrificans]